MSGTKILANAIMTIEAIASGMREGYCAGSTFGGANMKITVMGAAGVLGLLAAVATYTTAQADVTITQKTNLDVASLITTHGASTLSLTADKQRDDTESHCEGVMSIVCGNVQSGDIVRLDKDLSWYLEPKKKLYRETVFASPAELAAMRAKMQANLDKMNSCPVSQKQQPIDKSKCQMSPPKYDVQKTGDRMTIAGYDAQHTRASLTETCTNNDTGDVCDTVIALDVWLTQDALPGSSERLAFSKAYAKKLGLDETANLFRGDVAKYLAPYQSQIKELTSKSAALKGQSLRTSIRVLIGGPNCAATKNGGSSSTSTANSSDTSSNPLNNVNQAGKAVGSFVGGLFHKKKTDDSQAAAPVDAPATVASATPLSPDPFALLTQLGSFTVETVSISTDAIPADRFDIPAGWTKEVPKPTKAGTDEFTCPKSGS
jgi:hypothetical protein